MNVFRVLKPGLFTTVQDTGRHGYLKYGVPMSGAMDTLSLITANALVANDPQAACLETTLIGPELETLTKAQIALTGGDTESRINGQSVPMGQTLEVKEGDRLTFGNVRGGCRVYISIRGGINVPLILGSRSTYVRGGFGGIEGRQLRTGDIIKSFDSKPFNVEYSLPENLTPQFASNFTVHVILGPQADMFTENGLDTFLSNPFKVTLEADRMGYRLEGQPITHKGEADIVSDALLPGATQVPKSGMPIVIMRDAQTTGGYPKIAVVTMPDVVMLGQAKPGDTVEFSKTTMHQAQEKFKEYFKRLGSLKASIRKA